MTPERSSGIIRWRPRPAADPPKPVDSRFAYRRNGQTYYSVWPAGRKEPPGNPVKWSEDTLRHSFEKVDDGGQGAGE